MVLSLMMPAFADDADGHQWGHAKQESKAKQPTPTATTTTMTQPNVLVNHSSGLFKHIPVLVPNGNAQNNTQNSVQRPQPQIQNAPVGNRPNQTAPNQQVQNTNIKFDSRDRRDNNWQDHRRYHNDYDGNNWRERNRFVNINNNQPPAVSMGSDGYVRAYDPNLTSRGYVRADNSAFSSDGYIRMNQNSNVNYGNSRDGYFHDRDNQGWRDRGWAGQYRMPYRQGYSDRYRVYYSRNWPSNYGWREHGWYVDYRDADPYWFAVITSIALAQAWSDAELTVAINDSNLRQQLIYDEDIRQQMIASGYPVDQMYYSSDYGDQYDNPYDLNTTYSTQTTTVYYPSQASPPVASSNPNSPLYNGVPLASGDQIANRNANQNALFFCNAGNKQQTADALRQIRSSDMSIWKTMESYNKCRTWATAP